MTNTMMVDLRPLNSYMKCATAKKIADLFCRLMPKITIHEWDNISSCDEYEHYICKHCMIIEKRFKNPALSKNDDKSSRNPNMSS